MYLLARAKASSREGGEGLLKKTAEELKEELNELKQQLKKTMRLMVWLCAVSVCLSAIINVQVLFMAYSNSVISRFNQELTIITPDITEQQRQIYQSRFASMKTRAEFVSLFDEINKIAEAHGKPKSNFIPW